MASAFSRLYRHDHDRDCVHTPDHCHDDHICGHTLDHRHNLGRIHDGNHDLDHDLDPTFLRRPSEAHSLPARESLKWP